MSAGLSSSEQWRHWRGMGVFCISVTPFDTNAANPIKSHNGVVRKGFCFMWFSVKSEKYFRNWYLLMLLVSVNEGSLLSWEVSVCLFLLHISCTETESSKNCLTYNAPPYAISNASQNNCTRTVSFCINIPIHVGMTFDKLESHEIHICQCEGQGFLPWDSILLMFVTTDKIPIVS